MALPLRVPGANTHTHYTCILLPKQSISLNSDEQSEPIIVLRSRCSQRALAASTDNTVNSELTH